LIIHFLSPFLFGWLGLAVQQPKVAWKSTRPAFILWLFDLHVMPSAPAALNVDAAGFVIGSV
jgi:hypothetical protein